MFVSTLRNCNLLLVLYFLFIYFMRIFKVHLSFNFVFYISVLLRFMVKPHTHDIRVHTSDIRMTYEYIRVTYGWHTSTYDWHTSTYDWHTDDIQLHTSDIRMTYEWHTNDIQFERKIKLTFRKLFINSLSKYLISKRVPCMQWLFWVIYQN